MIEELRRIKLAEVAEEETKIIQEYSIEGKYNWFERNIFKRKEYSTYVKQQEKNRKEKLAEIEKKKDEYRYAVCIQQLGYDLESAIAILKQNGVSIVLTEEEMKEFTYKQTKPDVDSMEGIILVHKTNYIPSQGKIRTVKDSDVYENVEYQIAEHTISMKIKIERDTVHFAANGEVQEHIEGSAWDQCKYAVLIPFNDIPKEQYANVYPNDTYTLGSVSLTNKCWILVPKGEAEEVRRNNPGINVIEYEGKNVTGYADKLIRMLGYSQQQIDPGAYGGWRDGESNNMFYHFVSKEGFRSGIHYLSKEQYQEKFSRAIQIIIGMIKYVENHPETLSNPKFVEELKEQIKSQLVYAGGAPKNICQDLYGRLISEGYELPEELIAKLSKKEEQYALGVQYELAGAIVTMIQSNNQTSLEQTQSIKK